MLSKTANGQITRYSYDALINLTQIGLCVGTILNYVSDGKDYHVGKAVNRELAEVYLYQGDMNPIIALDTNG